MRRYQRRCAHPCWLIDTASQNKYKINMQQSFRRIKCHNDHAAASACLSHDCQVNSPFQCNASLCNCGNLHLRCKTMKISALQDYLIHWEKWIGKESQHFMSKVAKIYANTRDKLKREEQLFVDYCKTMFVGKDHGRVVSLIERQEYHSLTSQLLSSSLSKITEATAARTFDQFTHSEMRKIDERIRNLTEDIEMLYKSKEMKKAEHEKLARCCSVALQKSTISKKSDLPERSMIKSSLQMDYPLTELIKIKTDLTFPKAINSKIVQEASILNRLIGKKVKKYHLTYRATESSFSISEFYRKHNVIFDSFKANMAKSDQKQELLSIIIAKTEFGKITGGITALKWDQKTTKYDIDSDEDSHNPQAISHSQKSGKYRQDTSSSTNMFSLDLMQRYDLLKPQQAIYCGRTSIGFGKRDLRIIEKGNTTRKNYCKFPSSFQYIPKPYTCLSKSGMSLSGSKYSPFFKLEQWQAFVVEL